MLVVIASCFCGLTGCKGKYDDMTLEVSANSIELFLGETDNDGKTINNTAEFTATVGGTGEDISKELTQPALSTSGVVSVTQKSFDEETGKTTYVVSANDVSTEPVVITVRTKEGNKTATVNVTVIKRITGMSANSGAKQDLFAVVGETKNINTISAITFEPNDTNQKDGVWTISNKNGHEAEITENGDLLVTKKNGTNPLELTFTSSVSGITSVKVNVQVVNPIKTEDIKLMLDEETEIESYYKWQVLDLDDSDMRLQAVVDTNEEYTLSASVNGETKVISASKETDNQIDYIQLNTVGNTGTNTLTVTVTLNGYNYTASKNIKIQVARLPKEIKVNGEDLTNKTKTYDIYDKYQNNLGQRFVIEIDQDATDRIFTLSVSEEQRNQLVAVLQDGTTISLDSTQTFSSGTIFYVKAVEDYDATVQPSLVVSTINGDESLLITSTLNFSLRTSAQSVEVKAYGEQENMLFIEKGKQIELEYNLDSEKAFAGEIYAIGYDDELIDVEIQEVTGELPRILITAKNVTLSSNVTSLRLQLANGMESETVSVYVYTSTSVSNISVSAPKETDTQYGKYIASATYDYGVLTDLVLAKGGLIKLNVNALNDANQEATIFAQNFSLVNESDRTFLSLNDQGFVSARMVKEDDEGVSQVKVTVSILQPKGENGDATVETKDFIINVSIFVQITSISLDTQFINLYYKNNLWYEKDQISKLNQEDVNLSIYPQNAKADKIEWQLSNDDVAQLDLSNDDKNCLLTGLEGNETRQISLTVFVYQKNRVFSKTCYVNMMQIVKPNKVVIDGVSKNGILEDLPDSDHQMNIAGGLKVTAKDLYVDVRDITDNTNMQIKAYVPEYVNNNRVTNTAVCYEIVNGDAVEIDASGKIKFLTQADGTYKSGTVLVKVYAQGAKTVKNAEPTVKEYVEITIADGEKEETAFRVANENEFNQMLNDENIKSRYYKLTNNIYLKNDFSSLALPSNFAPRSLSGQGYTIYGLNINKVRTITIKEDDVDVDYNFISLFGDNVGTIKDINFELSINASINNTNAVLIAGLVANNENEISNVNITIKNLALSNLQDGQDVYIGGISAKNSGTIANSTIKGNININQTVILSSIYLGGIAGQNSGTIQSDNDNYPETKSTYLVNFDGEIVVEGVSAINSYVGGAVGYNAGIVSNMRLENVNIQATELDNVGGLVGLSIGALENNYINASVSGKENVGGLIGQIQGANVLKNIVELYENDRIVGNASSTINAIVGTNNVGGLIGYVCDTNSANVSNISNNYIKNYLSKLYIYSDEVAGGLIGKIVGGTATDGDITNTTVQTSFANVNTNANVAGGLIGEASACTVTNVYSRGKVEGNTLGELIAKGDVNLSNAYSSIALTSKTTNSGSVYYDKTATELSELDVFKASPWASASQNGVVYNDGYPILMLDSVVMEKNVPTTIVLAKTENDVETIIITEDTTNGIVLKASVGDKIDVNSVISIKDVTNNEISLNDLVIKSTDGNIFAIENNQIVVKAFGTADIVVYSKYDRNVYSSKTITLVHNVRSLEIHDENSENSDPIEELKLQVNKNQYVYSYIKDIENQVIVSDNIYVAIVVADSEYVITKTVDGATQTSKAFTVNGQELVQSSVDSTYYYTYISNSQMLISALAKTTANISLCVVEKVGDKFYALTDAQQFTLEIFEGIKLISIDKQEVNLTTMNEVNFVVTVVSDVDNNTFVNNFVEAEEEGNGKICINYNNTTLLADEQDLVLTKTMSTSYADGVYTHTISYSLKMRDEYLLLNSQSGQERKELKEGFQTSLIFGFNSDISSLTAQIQIVVEPQELLKIDALHFPNGLTTTITTGSGTQEMFNANELPSNTITPGEFGLLMVDIYPEYAYFDEIEVYYTTDSNYTMTFVQVALAQISEDVSRYVEVKPNALIQDKKIVMSRISSVVFDKGVLQEDETEFTGRYYIKTLIPTKTPAGTKFNIIVRATTYVNKDGKTETVTLESNPITIEALPRPSVELETDADKVQTAEDGTIYIARGTTQTITAQTTNYSNFADFTISSLLYKGELLSKYQAEMIAKYGNTEEIQNFINSLVNPSNYTVDIKAEYNNASTTKSRKDEIEKLVYDSLTEVYSQSPSISTSGDVATLYVPLAVPSGTEIEVTSTVSRFINGIEIKEQTSVKFIVVDYVITGLSVDNESNSNSVNVVVDTTETVSLRLETKKATQQDNSEVLAAKSAEAGALEIIGIYSNLTESDTKTQTINAQTNIAYANETKLACYTSFINDINARITDKNKEISQLYETFDTEINPIWQWKDGNGGSSDLLGKINNTANIDKTTTPDNPLAYILIQETTADTNTLVLKGRATKEDAITNLFAEFKFKYEFNEETNRMEVVRDKGTKDVTTQVGCDIEIYITTSATIDRPTPIYTMDEFLSMSDADYILMNDLYFTSQDEYFTQSYSNNATVAKGKLNNTDYNYYYYDSNTRFTSITPKFKSLDGNGYKIYINSFALGNSTGSDSSYGFFNAIDENVLVRNLEIVFLNQVVDGEVRNSYTISTENVTSANFGIFVGQNNGIITNCNVSYYQVKDGSIQKTADKNFTLEVDSSVEVVMGGFVGVNKGYITNSKIGGVDFGSSNEDFNKVLTVKGNGKIGGFVGSNEFKISACYAQNIGVENSSSLIKDTQTAGFVAENTSKGKIIQSFAEGVTVDGNSKNYQAKDMKNIIKSNGYVGGFVHSNYGVINDSYANVPIQTPARSAGFVYLTSGEDAVISECFALSASINQEDTTAFSFFTGTDDMTKINVLDNATIENCFYQSDKVQLETDERFKEPASAVSSSKFMDFEEFYGFDSNIWSNDNTSNKMHLTLATTEQVTNSRRIISGVNYVAGTITNYTYSYVGDKEDRLGNSNNPVIVYNAASFLRVFDDTNELYDRTNERTTGYIRLVTDIDLENYLGNDDLKKLQTITFAGSLDGNGFEITNVGVLGASSNANESSNNADSFGLFKQIGVVGTSVALIKNLTIEVVEVAKSTSTMVGALAGKMENASLVNVHIKGDGITIEGRNIVGGVVGYVGKNSKLSNVSANVSVVAAYASLRNVANYANSDNGMTCYNTEKDAEAQTAVSYAGGIVGVLNNGSIDLKDDQGNYESLENLNFDYSSKSARLYVYGDITISGEIVGGIVGYNGAGATLYNSKFEIADNDNQLLVGKYSVGGLVGENHGSISISRIEVADKYVDDIDENFNNTSTLTLFSSDSTCPRYVGGLVGFMPEGKVDNCFSKANVVHPNAKYIAGLVGSLGKTKLHDYFTYVASENANEFVGGSGKRDELIGYLGAVVQYSYSTGTVWTNPNYKYSYGTNGTKTVTDDSVLTNGTIKEDITATPQNYVGGMVGELNVCSLVVGGTTYLLTNVFEDNVSIVNWRDTISGYSNIERAMNGVDEENKELRKDELKATICDANGNSTGTIYKTNTGYLAGVLTITTQQYSSTDKGLVNVTDPTATIETIKSTVNDSYLYLNNFIGSGTKKITNQVANGADLAVEFRYQEGYATGSMKTWYDGDENTDKDGYLSYDDANFNFNLRTVYREASRKASEGYFANFSERYWELTSSVYPKLLTKQSSLIVRIYSEADLSQLSNTSSAITTYYLMNDIYLTKNWEPVKGFKGIFMSGDGGPYTIYNINIKTTDQNSVGFFATTQNATISNVNFVFGGKLDPRKDSTKTDYDQSNINFELKDNKSTGKFDLEAIGGKTLTTWSDYPNGISAQFTSQTQTNLSALVGENHASSIINVGLRFASGATISAEYSGYGEVDDYFGLVSAQTVITAGNSCQLYGINLDEQLNIGDTGGTGDLQTTLTFNSLLYYVKNLNVGGLFGQIDNQLKTNISVYKVNVNIPINIKTTGSIALVSTNADEVESNNAVALGGLVGKAKAVSFGSVNVTKGGTIDTDKISLWYADSAYDDFYIFASAMLGYGENVSIKDCHIGTEDSYITLNWSNGTAVTYNKRVYVGGLVGYANAVSTTNNSHTMVYCNLNISSTEACLLCGGGVVGFLTGSDSSFEKVECVSNISVANDSSITDACIGGFVGLAEGGTFNLCIPSGDVVVSSKSLEIEAYLGGFIGYGAGSKVTLTDCYALSNVKVKDGELRGDAYIGGFVGGFVRLDDSITNGSITNCISLGYVSATIPSGYLGGFVGYQTKGVISYCSSFATLFTNNYITTRSRNIGGFIGGVNSSDTTASEPVGCSYAYQLAGVADNGYGILKTYKARGYVIVTKNGNVNTSVGAGTYIRNIKYGEDATFAGSVLIDTITASGSKINPITSATTAFEANTNYYVPSGAVAKIDSSEMSVGENATVLFDPRAKASDSCFATIGENSLVSGLTINYTGKTYSESLAGDAFAGFAQTNNGTIFDCYVTGSVKVEYTSVSGFVGENNGSISNSSSSLKMDTANFPNGEDIAGFVTTNNGSIAFSYTNGEINNVATQTDAYNLDSPRIAGFAINNSKGALANCYSATVCIDVNNRTAGLVQTNTGTVDNCYYDYFALNGNTDFDDTYTYTIKRPTILDKNHTETVTENFYRKTTSFFLDVRESVVNFVTKNGGNGSDNSYSIYSNIWTINYEYNYGYPILQRVLGTESSLLNTGDGESSSSPYLINHGGRLDWIRTRTFKSNTKQYFKQVHDIDMSAFGDRFTTIGTSINSYSNGSFAGNSSSYFSMLVYDGNNYVIKNLKLDGSAKNQSSTYLALFAMANTVTNLGVDVTITNATQKYVGGLVAYLNPSYSQMYQYGYEFIYKEFKCYDPMSISNCFVNADIKIVTSSSYMRYIGGIVGYACSNKHLRFMNEEQGYKEEYGDTQGVERKMMFYNAAFTMMNSFATGTITDTSADADDRFCVGGLVGYGDEKGDWEGVNEQSSIKAGSYTNCYSAVSIIRANDNSDVKTYPISCGATDTKMENVYYDPNISLCTGNVGTSISFANSWLQSTPSNKFSSSNWTYSKYNYPVQTWIVKNKYALDILGYKTGTAKNGTGSKISPYQVTDLASWNAMTTQYSNAVWVGESTVNMGLISETLRAAHTIVKINSGCSFFNFNGLSIYVEKAQAGDIFLIDYRRADRDVALSGLACTVTSTTRYTKYISTSINYYEYKVISIWLKWGTTIQDGSDKGIEQWEKD